MPQTQVALVTGASMGIGRATASALAQRGFRVFGTTRHFDPNEAHLPNLAIIGLDVRDPDSVSSAVRSVMVQAGRIDVLVNNAGITLIGAPAAVFDRGLRKQVGFSAV